jgi:lysophospholipid acyltransferase (LPLAT)-like uncharacterized protein
MKKRFREKIILFIATILSRPILLIFRSSLWIRVVNRRYVQDVRRKGESVILSFWHENMILPLLVHDGQKINVLVSRHFDGEIIARVLWGFGLPSVRGSSTRGGREAYRILKTKISNGRTDVAFTPDGPTGPRRKMKMGVVRLASETGNPIIPVGVAATRFRRLKSWDRLLLVLPFSHCVHLYGQPFYIPKTSSQAELQRYADKLTSVTNDLDEEAQKCLFS